MSDLHAMAWNDRCLATESMERRACPMRDQIGFDVARGAGIAPIGEGPHRDGAANRARRSTALSAFSRYGKGRGHPAQLNLGDCFAYAVAKNHRRALLFKGDDFDKTDIRSASHSR